MNRCAEKAPGQDQVPAAFQTKSLTRQLRAEPKRKRIADDIEPVTHEAESEEHPTEDLRTYVAFRLTLMFAYARAGCTKLLDAPTSPKPRTVALLPASRSPLTSSSGTTAASATPRLRSACSGSAPGTRRAPF